MASAPTRPEGSTELQPADWRWMAVLFLLALAPRLVHLFTVTDSPFFSLLILDPLMYDEWGWALARGEATGGVFFQAEADAVEQLLVIRNMSDLELSMRCLRIAFDGGSREP